MIGQSVGGLAIRSCAISIF